MIEAAWREPRRGATLALLGALLVLALVLSIGVGTVSITPLEVLGILLEPLGLAPDSVTHRQVQVVWNIRLPRAVLGAVMGATLAVSGAGLQGLFRNPLVDPGLVGISSGAALAAACTIVLLGNVLGALSLAFLPLAAFGGAVVTTFMVWRIGMRDGRTVVTLVLLGGIAIGSLAMAGTGLLTLVANDRQLRDITFWTMGSLNGATWPRVAAATTFALPALLSIPRLSTALDALLLGESEASHLGISVERVKQRIAMLCALAVGAQVAVAGVIGFVGLVVPHLVRLTWGPAHRFLLPASALLGATLLLCADVISRMAIAPAEIPIGIVTALTGAPFFLWLLRRHGGDAT